MESNSSEKINEIGAWIKDHAIDVAILGVAIVYVCSGFFLFGTKGKSVAQIIGEGFLFYIVCSLIANMLLIKGLNTGHKNKDVIATVKEYEEFVKVLKPKIHLLSGWCVKRNEAEIIEQQDRILLKFGITHEKLKDSKFLSESHSKELEKAINKCFKLNIHELTADELTNEIKVEKNKFKLGKTQQEFMQQASMQDLITRAAMAVFFGYYGFTFVKNIDWGAIFLAALQISISIICGVLKYNKGVNYVVNDYRNRFIKKMNFLNEFDNETQIADETKEAEDKIKIKGEEENVDNNTKIADTQPSDQQA